MSSVETTKLALMLYTARNIGILAAAAAATTLFGPSLGAQSRDLGLTTQAERRLALVVGNNDYLYAPKLANARNDAVDLTASLQELGFEVDQLIDADLRTFDRALDAFVAKLSPGDVALFHFSGHGMEVGGENYLIPIDFKLTDEASVRYDAYSASKLHDRLAGASSRLNIVMLDACRNNGFRSSRSNRGGLAMMNAAEGSFIAFATGPGTTADDNRSGRNGLFTANLLEALREPGLSLDAVFNRVREEVYDASSKRQLPWTSSSVIGDFYFRYAMPEPEQSPTPIVEAPAPVRQSVEADIELTYWRSIADSGNPALLESYLKRFPTGYFSDLARIQLTELKTAEAPAPPWTQPQPEQQPAPVRPAEQQAIVEQPRPAQPMPAQPRPESSPRRPPSAPGLLLEHLPLLEGDGGVESYVARNDAELRVLAVSIPQTVTPLRLTEGSGFARVGSRGVEVMLKKVDTKKGRFTLVLHQPAAKPSAGPTGRAPTLRPDTAVSQLAKGAAVSEKKNVEAGRPLQFNLRADQVCDEIVIMRVEPGQVVGYYVEAK